MTTVVQLAPIPAEVRERITEAANALFEQAGHQALPTVDQVRRLARVDMNAASTVMREWRREQTARAAPTPVQVPEPLMLAQSQALAALWTHAQQLANESLLLAQAGWEEDRANREAIRLQVSNAYEAKEAELEQLKVQAAAATQAHQAAAAQAAAGLATARADLAQALARADRADARLVDVEQRSKSLEASHDHLVTEVAQLRAQLEQASRDVARANEAALQADERHSEQRKHTAAETHRTVERMTRAEAERDESRRETAKARETAARLHGQIEALQTQMAELLRTLGPGPGGGGGAGQGGPPRRTGP